MIPNYCKACGERSERAGFCGKQACTRVERALALAAEGAETASHEASKDAFMSWLRPQLDLNVSLHRAFWLEVKRAPARRRPALRPPVEDRAGRAASRTEVVDYSLLSRQLADHLPVHVAVVFSLGRFPELPAIKDDNLRRKLEVKRLTERDLDRASGA
jgi:hypothetical protein